MAVDDRHRQQGHAGSGRQQGGASLGIIHPAIALAGAVDEYAGGPTLEQAVGGGADGLAVAGTSGHRVGAAGPDDGAEYRHPEQLCLGHEGHWPAKGVA